MAEKQSIRECMNRQEESLKGQLLNGRGDKYGIYQLKDNPETVRLQFRGTESLKEAGIIKDDVEAVAIRPENYDLVYVGDLSELVAKTAGIETTEDKLHMLFEEFNIYKPSDFTGHSLSVSDIVVLHEDGKNSAHYVDTVGYTEMPHFVRGLEEKMSLRKNLAECKTRAADEEKKHPTKKQEKEISL